MKETTYTHYKNKRSYRILNAGKMQINQEWFDCVVYQDIESLEVYVREESSFDKSFLAENLIDKLQKYRLIYEDCMNRIGGLLEEEMRSYSEFLADENISVLSDGFYKNGKKLDYGDVRRLYDKSIKK